MGRPRFDSVLGYHTRLVKCIVDNSHDANYIVQQFPRLKGNGRFSFLLQNISVRHSRPQSSQPSVDRVVVSTATPRPSSVCMTSPVSCGSVRSSRMVADDPANSNVGLAVIPEVTPQPSAPVPTSTPSNAVGSRSRSKTRSVSKSPRVRLRARSVSPPMTNFRRAAHSNQQRPVVTPLLVKFGVDGTYQLRKRDRQRDDACEGMEANVAKLRADERTVTERHAGKNREVVVPSAS